MNVCFESRDLRRLFDTLPPGQKDVTVALEGALLSGVRFRAPFPLTVTSASALVSLASPNPIAESGTLTFASRVAAPCASRSST
jgi:hypothetical protein